jgi:hypothetical protein
MLPIKNNLSARRYNGLAYRVACINFGNGITAPYVAWDHEPVMMSADAALAIAMGPASTSSGDSSALAEAIAFIEDEFLMAERIEASDLAAWARKGGHLP